MTTPPDTTPTPPDLAAIESLAERLAQAERASADAGLESRLFAASRTAMAVRTEGARPIPFPSPSASRAWRLAAAIAIVAVGGLFTAAWFGRTTPAVTAPPSVVASVDSAAIREDLDAWLASFEADDASTLADVAPLEDSFLSAPELFISEEAL